MYLETLGNMLKCLHVDIIVYQLIHEKWKWELHETDNNRIKFSVAE